MVISVTFLSSMIPHSVKQKTNVMHNMEQQHFTMCSLMKAVNDTHLLSNTLCGYVNRWLVVAITIVISG